MSPCSWASRSCSKGAERSSFGGLPQTRRNWQSLEDRVKWNYGYEPLHYVYRIPLLLGRPTNIMVVVRRYIDVHYNSPFERFNIFELTLVVRRRFNGQLAANISFHNFIWTWVLVPLAQPCWRHGRCVVLEEDVHHVFSVGPGELVTRHRLWKIFSVVR